MIFTRISDAGIPQHPFMHIDFRIVTAVLFCPLLVAVGAVAAVPDTLPLDEEMAFRSAANRVADSVVRIEATGETAEGLGAAVEARPGSGPSSGIIVDSDGWILTTSFAVPQDAKEAIVILSSGTVQGTRKIAKIFGRDLGRELVLLKVETSTPLPVPEWVPRKELVVGQWTIAVGRALSSTAPSLAVGILSATNRAWGKAVQTDAAVSPTNYGGALIDIKGRVIGILAPLPADTAGMNLGTELYDSGIGFAVPLEDVIRVLPRLKKGERLTPGILGISYRSRDLFTAEAIIATCHGGSPAAQAGLRAGDTIIAANGCPVTRIAELRHVLAPHYAGDTLELVVDRRLKDGGAPNDSQRLTKRVTLVTSLPVWKRGVIGIVPARTGSEATATNPLTVAWVWPDGPAAKAGVVAGDVIESITSSSPDTDNQSDVLAVDSSATLAGIISGMHIGQSLEITILRDGKRSSLKMATAPMPNAVPAAVPTVRPADQINLAGQIADKTTVSKLELAEVARPALVVLPAESSKNPLGVLVYFGVPHSATEQKEAAAWKTAAALYNVAIVLPESGDPQRWSREDIAGVARSLDALRSRRSIDPTRVGVAGRGAGAAFAWIVAEAFGPSVRGAALLDSALPRQATVAPTEPGQACWVLFGFSTKKDAAKADADRKRLESAGYPVGIIDTEIGTSIPTDLLCAWVEALGVL